MSGRKVKARVPGLAVLALALGACSGGGKAPADGGAPPEKDLGLTVSDTRARACDVLIGEGTRQVVGATFDAGVKGQWNRWEPRVALAFTALADAPIARVGTLKLRILKDEAQFPSVDVTCYDRAGAKLPGAKVTIK